MPKHKLGLLKFLHKTVFFQITIEILDTNNKTPFPDTSLFNNTVYIYENATSGDPVLQLYAGDYDRDGEIFLLLIYAKVP